MRRAVIGITVDNQKNTAESGVYESSIAYSRAVEAAGGLPVLLPHVVERVSDYFELCDGFILTGGVDPDVRAFGFELHGAARVMDVDRQAFEVGLLERLEEASPDTPVLGVCLGMQLMALVAGGELDQFMPESMGEDAALVHQGDRRHTVEEVVQGTVLAGGGEVVSSHRQAVGDSGAMRVIGRAPDGVVEAIDEPGRRFCVGVQWHPERGGEGALSAGVIEELVRAAGAGAGAGGGTGRA
ncbi:MAG: gamma-glutamyl-gamma-aminobutyrate hydrolase family protein [Planctomycetota bacterium]